MRSEILIFFSIIGCSQNLLVESPGVAPAPAGASNPGTPSTPTTAGGPENTFDHEGADRDPFSILSRQMDEGAPEIATRLHSCQKVKYGTLGRLLASRGVNLAAPAVDGGPTAGSLYQTGAQALGAPNYGARVAEAIEGTAAGTTKLFDIFLQAAPEIIAALPQSPACVINGQGAVAFDAAGRCDASGMSCLLGYPVSDQMLALCNRIVAEASSPALGQRLAVGALLAAVHACE